MSQPFPASHISQILSDGRGGSPGRGSGVDVASAGKERGIGGNFVLRFVNLLLSTRFFLFVYLLASFAACKSGTVFALFFFFLFSICLVHFRVIQFRFIYLFVCLLACFFCFVAISGFFDLFHSTLSVDDLLLLLVFLGCFHRFVLRFLGFCWCLVTCLFCFTLVCV